MSEREQLIEEARGMLARLTADVIDDPEDLLCWLGTDGITVIREWLEQQGSITSEA